MHIVSALFVVPMSGVPPRQTGEYEMLLWGGILAGAAFLAMAWLLYTNVRRRRYVEQMLLETRREWTDVLQAIGHPVLILDPESRITMVNEAAARAAAVPAEELLGQPCYRFYHRSDAPPTDCPLAKMRASGRMEVAEMEGLGGPDRDGRRVYLISCTPLLDGQGRLQRVIHIAMDVTDRKRTEESLLQSQARLQSIFRAAPTGIGLVSNRVILEVNERMCQMVGYSRDELIGQSARMLYPSQQEFEYVGRVKYAQIYKSSTGTVETRWQRQDGRIMDILLSSTPIDPAHLEAGVTFTALDITERKHADVALQESEARYRTLVEEAHDMIYTSNLEGTMTSLNPAFEAMTGWSAVEWLGRKLDACIHPDDLSRSSQGFEACLRGEAPPPVEARFRSKWGEYRVLEFRVKPLIQEGQVWGILGTARDMTERIQAEQEIRRLNAELEERVVQRTAELQAKTLELEAFAYSVSHDLKAPLRAIDGYSQLLLQGHANQLGNEGQRFLGNIRRAIGQMDQLIGDLLAYSRLERRSFVPGQVDLGDLVGRLVHERADEIGERQIDVAVEVPPSGEWVTADVEGLAQAVRNLLDNALKFTRDVPQPRIEVGRRRTENECILWVRDNGIGFDMAYHDRLFEIFERLHRTEEYPGTGIGLTIVRKAMQRIGGRVWAESTPGAGATFYLQIPTAQE